MHLNTHIICKIRAIHPSMHPVQTNRHPLCSANERGSAEPNCTSIGCDIPSVASGITPGSVTPRVISEADTKEDTDRGRKIGDDYKDPLSDNEGDHDDDTTEPNYSIYNNHKDTAQLKINLEEMVNRQPWIMVFISSITPNYVNIEDHRPHPWRTSIEWHCRNTTKK